MKSEDRRAVRTAYKERDVSAGIFVVRCPATGQQWVGRAPDLSTIETRLRFDLRHGNNPHRSLMEASRAHGIDGLVFEVVERIDRERLGSFPQDVLRERQKHWRDELGAEAI